MLNSILVPNLVECDDRVVWENKDGNIVKKKISMVYVDNNWKEILNRVTIMACNNSIRSILRRIVLAASVYYIWDERNKRLFGNQKRDYKTVLLMIINNMRMKLVSFKVRNSSQVANVSKEWQIPLNGNTNNEN
ncbi:hypothetical protein Tco_0505600 [Tanacetum coccineum]